MERVQEAIRTILQHRLPAELAARENPPGLEPMRLPAPRRYLINFDEGFTVIAASDYPAVIILPGSSIPVNGIAAGLAVDYVHEVAIVALVMERDIERLQRMRSRYAEAIQACLLKHQKDPQPACNLLRFTIRAIRYDRSFRDDEKSPYRSSVWVIIEARERVEYA